MYSSIPYGITNLSAPHVTMDIIEEIFAFDNFCDSQNIQLDIIDSWVVSAHCQLVYL